VFTTAGDSFAAAFARGGDAVDATVAAQGGLVAEPWPEATTIRVRMGLHTGEAQERGGDYFGSVLNRAARVMAAGHGGQILVGASTASVVDGADVDDLGEHRLKDLSGVEHLFQIRAEGLESDFPPLRTVDKVPGNLPSQSTSFVGRDNEVKELSGARWRHRMRRSGGSWVRTAARSSAR
jgi:class 3 adenylate cyclase